MAGVLMQRRLRPTMLAPQKHSYVSFDGFLHLAHRGAVARGHGIAIGDADTTWMAFGQCARRGGWSRAGRLLVLALDLSEGQVDRCARPCYRRGESAGRAGRAPA